VVGQQNANIVDTLQPRDIAMATMFWFSVRYNFGRMIANDTTFDSWGEISGCYLQVKLCDPRLSI